MLQLLNEMGDSKLGVTKNQNFDFFSYTLLFNYCLLGSREFYETVLPNFDFFKSFAI